MLPSWRVVHKRLVLDQILIIWKVKCSGEREEMDSHLEIFWFFIWAPYFNSLEWWYGSCLSLFFKLLLLQFFLRRRPILHEDRFIGTEHCLDRPFEMDRLTVEILGFCCDGNCLAKVDINTRGRWLTCQTFEASKTMGTQRRKIGRSQVPSSNGLTIRQSSK